VPGGDQAQPTLEQYLGITAWAGATDTEA
jgi:hypothetical protein